MRQLVSQSGLKISVTFTIPRGIVFISALWTRLSALRIRRIKVVIRFALIANAYQAVLTIRYARLQISRIGIILKLKWLRVQNRVRVRLGSENVHKLQINDNFAKNSLAKKYHRARISLDFNV